MNIQDWFPLGLTSLISLQSKGLSRVFFITPVRKYQFFGAQPSLWSSSHIFTWLLENHTASSIQTFVSKVMSLLFNMLFRFVVAFLPRSKYLLIFMAVVTICSDFGAQEDKVWHCFPIYSPWSDGTRCHDLSFWMLSFKPAFHSPLFILDNQIEIGLVEENCNKFY